MGEKMPKVNVPNRSFKILRYKPTKCLDLKFENSEKKLRLNILEEKLFWMTKK